jgi:hypothetical protein
MRSQLHCKYMKSTLSLLISLLIAPLASLHAADAPQD